MGEIMRATLVWSRTRPQQIYESSLQKHPRKSLASGLQCPGCYWSLVKEQPSWRASRNHKLFDIGKWYSSSRTASLHLSAVTTEETYFTPGRGEKRTYVGDMACRAHRTSAMLPTPVRTWLTRGAPSLTAALPLWAMMQGGFLKSGVGPCCVSVFTAPNHPILFISIL